MTIFELPRDEVLEAVAGATFEPFTPQLQLDFNAFKVTVEFPLFAEFDGLYLVKNGDVVEYISDNGAFYGEIRC